MSVFENLHSVIFVVVSLSSWGYTEIIVTRKTSLFISYCKLSYYDEFLFPIIYCFTISL